MGRGVGRQWVCQRELAIRLKVYEALECQGLQPQCPAAALWHLDLPNLQLLWVPFPVPPAATLALDWVPGRVPPVAETPFPPSPASQPGRPLP